MEAFLQLLSQNKIITKELITHRFDIGDAEKAYQLVTGEIHERHIGILLNYPDHKEKFDSKIIVRQNPLARFNIGFIGAGSFAQSYLIPNVKSNGASLQTVVTSKGITAKNVADKFGFGKASSNAEDIISDDAINTVFIATPHNSHARFVLSALRAGKNVFVEKPLAMREDELDEIKEYYEVNGGNLMVGYNRRFSPAASGLKKYFSVETQPLIMNYRINAGFIPKDHWTQDENTGGGRIIGEVCHFIDLMHFFSGSLVENVFAQCISSANNQIKNDDNLAIILKFRNGSIGNIIYTANGDMALPKERLEIFGGNKAGILNDFKNAELYSGNKVKTFKLEGKGHREEINEFFTALSKGTVMPIDFASLYLTNKATFKILDSLYTGLPQQVK
jgi:polar amino acid transport system substrate-binding protein